ncbi:MAG: DEAD/DEAH box helicase [Clostridia bacterium]|nr:DEAD/DEAH box helicase [Clostridia bacterium]
MSKTTSAPFFTVLFTQDGYLLDFPADAPSEQAASSLDTWQREYTQDRESFLFHLGFSSVPSESSPAFQYLAHVASRFVSELSRQSALEITREQTEVPLSEEAAQSLLDAVPFALGSEYIDEDWLRARFLEMQRAFCREIAAYEGTVALFLAERADSLRLPERIFFHLVENKRDDDFPFAFLATYTTRDEKDLVRHMPLSFALTEFKGDREKLITLLACLNDAADKVPLIAQWMVSGELFHPLRLSSEEAYTLLKAVPDLEAAGISCRLPNWWRRKAASVSLTVHLGEKKQSLLGLETLLSMVPTLTLDGMKLTKKDIQDLLRRSDGLAMIKGKWVEVSHEKLEALLEEMERYDGDISLMQALHMQSGIVEDKETAQTEITNGRWLSTLLSSLRKPETLSQLPVPASVHASLRPYQESGYAWLTQMLSLGLGACLADDMGLGKTLQVLTLLARLYETSPDTHVLLVVPASLLGNWEKEIERFTPSFTLTRLHGLTPKKMEKAYAESEAFLTLTTYGVVTRFAPLRERKWDLMILDEAQAIKNPGTKQTKAVKQLQGTSRIAMTGTPIENDLSNLWSLFDFLNAGLLGSSKEFSDFTKRLAANPEGYARLKRMVSPFILRRLKTDRSIISDLPDRIDQTDYISLTKTQVTLYREKLKEIASSIPGSEGMQRRGLVLAALSQFKQICNHPDQYLGQETYDPEESGKFQYLREICETIRDKHERVLVFTQYREITPALDRFLAEVFGRSGLVLHGGTRVRERSRMVEMFNGETYIPYMILTIKAGGTGLNLTAANHVVLFDRWWNPAVENQAMDRAFRIGQTKNVFVHRFVAQGTIEERIDQLLREKQQLSDEVIGEGSERFLTEMSDRELMDMLRLEV